MTGMRKAIVIGGGIAGQASALSLSKHGFKVQVYEQVKTYSL
jgi:phytoene dehydrogenase-like protein